MQCFLHFLKFVTWFVIVILAALIISRLVA